MGFHIQTELLLGYCAAWLACGVLFLLLGRHLSCKGFLSWLPLHVSHFLWIMRVDKYRGPR